MAGGSKQLDLHFVHRRETLRNNRTSEHDFWFESNKRAASALGDGRLRPNRQASSSSTMWT
jgi:hypothetical protein